MMNREPSSRSYKTSAVLFMISGTIFITLGALSSKVGLFLAVGIALVILSINFWRLSKKLK